MLSVFGLASSSLLLAFGGKKQRRHLFKCAPLNARKPPECFAFQLFDRIKSHRRPLWQQRIKPSLIEGYARALFFSGPSRSGPQEVLIRPLERPMRIPI